MSHDDLLLTLNGGSSSLKFGLFQQVDGTEKLLLSGSANGIGRDDGSLSIRDADNAVLLSREALHESQTEALTALAAVLQQHIPRPPAAVVHRIVHGGPHLVEHQRLTEEVFRQLQDAVHFAPLHIPSALELVRQSQLIFPAATQIACFDTVFHRTMPDVAQHLPLPQQYFDQGVMRFGFHGLSYESVVRRLGSELPKRAVLAHLGNGSSVTAVRAGKSVDTTMGLTSTGGVPMGTRTGDLDPGVILYLLRSERLSVDALEQLLNRSCGLAGLSGGESDMQALLQREQEGDRNAHLAIDAYCVAIRKSIGGFAALMGGVEMLVFTGGIGEHSLAIRERICEGFQRFGSADSLQVRVLPSEEEVQMALRARSILVHA